MIEDVLERVYGVGVLNAPFEAVLWAVESITDKATAKAELKRVNKIRSKCGVLLVHAPYGHHAF